MAFSISSHVGSIEAHRSLRDDLLAKVKAPSRRRRISVTDLLNPRHSFFKRTHPEIVPTLRQQQFMWTGTGFHDDFQRAVSKEEYVEQFVEWEGVVGKIDIYERFPLEIKTTGKSFEARDLPAMRPYYIEQVGMYCAMTGNSRGHLIVYSRSAGESSPALRAYEVFFSDIEAIRSEIRRRRDLLAGALERDDPAGLPRCNRFGFDCEYKEFCGCAGAEPFHPAILDTLAGIRETPEMAEEILGKLRNQPPAPVRLADLIFPRKAYFRLTSEEREAEEEMEAMEQQGMLQTLKSLLFRGAEGGVARVPVAVGEVRGRVTLYRDLPVVLRTPGFAEPVDRSRLVSLWPHYFERLALDCAFSGHERGRLVLYYTKVEEELAKFLVYDVSFKNLDAVRAEMERRAAALKQALESGDPRELQACPAWMQKFCAYAPGCGCGGQTTLSAPRQATLVRR